jgi:hypothetical protein
MATRRYSLNPGDNEYQVTEAVGAATATKAIELTVDLAVVTDANDKGKEAVLIALQDIENYILRGNWPPA